MWWFRVPRRIALPPAHILILIAISGCCGVAESLVLPTSLSWLTLRSDFRASATKFHYFTSCFIPKSGSRFSGNWPLRPFRSPASLQRRITASSNNQAADILKNRLISWIGELGKRLMPALFNDDTSTWKSLPSVVSWLQPRFFMQGGKRETLWETTLQDGRTIQGELALQLPHATRSHNNGQPSHPQQPIAKRVLGSAPPATAGAARHHAGNQQPPA
jgi:hypothetical protein